MRKGRSLILTSPGNKQRRAPELGFHSYSFREPLYWARQEVVSFFTTFHVQKVGKNDPTCCLSTARCPASFLLSVVSVIPGKYLSWHARLCPEAACQRQRSFGWLYTSGESECLRHLNFLPSKFQLINSLARANPHFRALIKAELYPAKIPDVRNLVACPEVDSNQCHGIFLLSR